MKIVVTGSEGGIGRYVVDEIKRQRPSDEIARVTRQIQYANEPGYHVGDLRRWSFAKSLVRDADIVIHAAAWPYDRIELGVVPLDILANDVSATMTLLEAYADRPSNGGGHVVLLSSATVYNQAPTPTPVETDDRRVPSGPVALGKHISEQAVHQWAAQIHGVATIWRLFNVITPHEQHEMPGHIQTDLYRRIFVDHEREIAIVNGDRMRCFTWVGDVAAAIVRYLDDERSWGETFNLGAIEATTAIELADTMIHVGHELGVLPADYNPPVSAWTSPPGGEVCMPDITKAKITLDWVPTTSLLACVRKFVQGKLVAARKEAS